MIKTTTLHLALLLILTVGLVAPDLMAQVELDDQPDPALAGAPEAEEEAEDDEPGRMADEDRDIGALPISPPDEADEAFVEHIRQYQRAFGRYTAEIADYQETVDAIVEAEYSRRVSQINDAYEARIRTNEAFEREFRSDAIIAFEDFVRRYPREELYTPDALFRLAELYFERSNDEYMLADEQYQVDYQLYVTGSIPDMPDDPVRDYTPTIETFRKLIAEWPEYRLLDGAYYLLAYAELQMGNEAVARDLFAELILNFPQSDFVPEAWVRIGEYHFDHNELDFARQAYTEAMKFEDSIFYDKALYKLAWTHYRQDNYDAAIRSFTQLVEWSDALERRTGQQSSLRPEAIQYIAISLAEEDWDLDGAPDPEFGIERARRYISGEKPYEREVLAQLGEYLFENARYPQSIDIYRFLLEKYPTDRRNPEIHERIILAQLRDHNLEDAFAERGLLNQYYGPGSDWYAYQQRVGNMEAIRYADNLVKENLIQSATWFHAEAQKLRNEGEVRQDEELLAQARQGYVDASRAYEEYLMRYPNDRDFYQWNYYFADSLFYSGNYFRAFEQYQVVREMDVTNNEFQEDSAFNAIKALERELELAVRRGDVDGRALGSVDEARETARAQETAREVPEDEQMRPIQEDEIPELVMQYVTTMDRYVVLNLRNEEDRYLDAKLAFQSAKVFYDYQHFDTARERFAWVVETYPENEVAYLAGSLLLETYRLEGDYASLAMWADRLANVIEGEQADAIRAEVREFQLGALFKSAEDLFAAGEFEAAAAEYVRLLETDPDTQFASKALNNAAVAYENVKRYESAMRLYERVYKEHPDDPLASYAMYRVAVNQERFFDFESAVQTYLLFHDTYRNRSQAELDELGLDFDLQEQRKEALQSAGVLTENLQQYEKAAELYERYARQYPGTGAADVQWQGVLAWQKAGNSRQMINAVEGFIRTHGSNPAQNERVLRGLMMVGEHHESRNDRRNADRTYRRILDEFASRGVRPGTPAAQYPAKAQFMLAERQLEEWEKVQIRGNLNQQRRLLEQKIEGQRRLTVEYEKVWEYASLEWTMASGFRIGNLFQQFAESLYNVPIPFPEDSDEYDIYRTQLEDIAIPLEDEAIERYEATIARARQDRITNEWTQRTLEELNKYKPQEYPIFRDERAAKQYRTVTGGDFIDAARYRSGSAE